MTDRHGGLHRIWALGFVGYLLLSGGISAVAYRRLIPAELLTWPLFDTTGHFILYGTAALLLDGALRSRRARLSWPGGSWSGPAAVLIAGSLAFLEEAEQLLSPNRTFDILDLAAGIAGMLALIRLAALVRAERRRYAGLKALGLA